MGQIGNKMIFIAKSNGLDFILHSNKVSEAAMAIANSSLNGNNIGEEITKAIKSGALLHDIGKLTNSFQSYLKKIKNKKPKYNHNEIGWAFLSKYLNISDYKLKNYILDIVYWHHGIPYDRKLEGVYDADILEDISTSDIDNMVSYLSTIFDDVDIYCNDLDDIQTPSYFDSKNSTNYYEMFIRSCVIGGDRLISTIDNDLLLSIDIKKLVQDELTRTNIEPLGKTEFDGSDRFEEQLNIVESAHDTTIIKAPAGFGKTILGLLWGIKNNKKILWVCPRNMVAKSVYHTINEELKKLNINLSVELFLHGDVVNSTQPTDGFDSDIIVTNIDNYLFTTTNNDKLSKLFIINNVNVIFDEYHEFVTDETLMSLFITTMQLRHRVLKANTLLLSATPISMEFLWDNINTKTNILPSKNNHYSAAHNRKYKLNVIDDFDSSIIKKDTNSLLITNSIYKSQYYKYNSDFKHLLHSGFMQDKKDKDFTNLIGNYGKASKLDNTKPNVIGTHILQASLDISFCNLYESTLSPESTLQRIGRCDRWGNQPIAPTITIFNDIDKSEYSTKKLLYDIELNNLWFKHIKQYNGQIVTLNDIYDIYNEFNIINNDKIKKFIKNKNNSSKLKLNSVYPIKFNTTKKDDGIISAGSNKLRSSGNEIFYLLRKHGTDEYVGTFNTKIYTNIVDDFNEDSMTRDNIMKVIKNLTSEYDYSNIIKNKNITIDKLRIFAKKSNMPYIRFDKVYHDELGEISVNKLNKILELK